ncbi:MAG: hypothetical protein RLZ25_2168 [Pseudomonadota bacterium]|jgi:dihydroneopterin aldolase
MTQMLASVTSLEEAFALLPLAIDILDLKNPARGALGALDLLDVRVIVEALPDQRISATVGDLPMVPEVIRAAVEAMAGLGVDYVKVGFFDSGDWQPVLDQLKPVADRGVKLVAVLFGDQSFSLSALPAFERSGFHGIMVDTAEKTGGGILAYRSLSWLQAFVGECQALGFLTGLAGSLSLEDIPKLKPLGADYLGFRGALCAESRTGALDLTCASRVRAAMSVPE